MQEKSAEDRRVKM